MPVTRINNNQITDASAGNAYVGINAASKVQEYSITSTKIANSLVYGSDLTIAGNLTVQGNTTTIDTVNVVVEDPLILLAAAQTGSPTLDIGFIGKRGTSDNIAFVWDEAQDKFVAVFTSSEVTNTTVTINSYASFKSLDNEVTGNLSVTGTSGLTGNVTVGNLFVDGQKTVDMGNSLVSNVQYPVANSDAATKQYVDDQASSGFTIEDDTANTTTVSGGDTLQLLGTTNEVTVAITDVDQITFGLPDDVTVTGNLSANNLSSTNQVSGATGSFSGNVIAGNVNANASVVATGNLAGNNAVITNDVSATTGTFSGNVLAGNVNSNAAVTGVTITASGNLAGNNAVITNDVSATTGTFSGNVLAGNVNSNAAVTGVTITASGNLEGNNATITNTVAAGNVTATGNVNMANSYVTGNVTAGNLVSTGAVIGNIEVTGNISVDNIDVSGNVLAGNLNSNAAVTGVTGVFSGNVSAANLSSAGLVEATGNVVAPTIVTTTVTTSSGDLTLTSAGGNLQWDGSGNIVMNSQWINNLSDPVLAYDAATKQYVDDAVSSGITIHTPVYLEAPVALPAATYAQGGTTATVTDTIAGNTVVFSSAINPQVNDQLWFTSSFNGIVANTAYFVVSAPNTSAAVLSASYDGAPVDNISNGTGLTQAVRINSGIGATLTGNSNGQLTVDGVNVSVNNRILVYNQTPAYENGVYVVTDAGNVSAPYILTRSADTDVYGPKSTQELDVGDYFYVQAGDTGAGESYVMTAPTGPFILGYDSITFTQFSASQVYTANTAAGIDLTGTVFSAKVDNDTTAFDGNGNIVVKPGANLTTPNIGAATGTSLSLTGNLIAGNITSNASIDGTTVTASGNLVGGNANITNGVYSTTVTATGNVDAGNVNATTNVTGTTLTASGNLVGGNANITNGVYTTTVTATGNVDAGNVSGTTLTASGNLVAGNANITDGVYTTTVTATGNVDAGNLNATTNVTGTTLTASGNLVGGNANITNGVYSTTVSATGNIDGGNVNATNDVTAITVTASGNVNAGNADIQFGVYSSTVEASGNIDGLNLNADASGKVTGGTFIASGNVIAGNAEISGDVSAATGTFVGNVDAGNLNASGFVTATTGTITGNLQAGNLTSLGNVDGINGNFSGNVTAANFIGNISGNIDAGGANTDIQFNDNNTLNGSSAFTFDKTSNLVTATGNIQAGNLISTALVSGTNVTASANVTGLVGNFGNLVISDNGITGTDGIVIINDAQGAVDFKVNGDNQANLFRTDSATDTVLIGTGTPVTGAKLVVNSTDSMLVPIGNTAQRPGTPTSGMLRYNTTTQTLEFYDNDSWESAKAEFTVITNDTFNGDGSTVTFTLSAAGTTASTIVSINGVVQIPTTAYSVTGTALTFTEAPSVSDVIDARVLVTTSTVTGISGAGGGLFEASQTNVAFDVTGNLIPSANVTYDLGSSSFAWNDLYLAGNTIYLGSLQLKDIGANTFAVYTYDGVTQANIDVGAIDVSALSSGTSTIGISGAGGNAYITVGGTANVLVASTTSVDIQGNLLPAADVTYDLGSSSAAWKDLWLSGNTINLGSIKIKSANGVMQVLNANTNQPAPVDVPSIQNGTSNVTVIANGNINMSSAGTPNVVVVTNTGANVAGTLNATGNIIGGNLSGTNVTGTLLTAAQPNITSVGTLSSLAVTGNITGGNLSGTNVTGTLTTAAQPNITSVGTLSSLTVTGNVTGGNLITTGTVTSGPQNITGNVSVTGNINVTGNLNYENVTDLSVGDPLIYIGANNTGNVYDLGMVVSYNDGTYQHGGWVRDASDGTWKLFGNVVAEPTTTVDFTDAIYQPMRAGAIIATTGTFTGNVSTGNVSGTTGTFTNVGGTLTTAAQTNITSVGTLGTLAVTGNVTTGNVSGTTGTFTNVGGTLTTAAQTNITSVGTLSSLTVSGNVTAGNLSVTTGTVTLGNIVNANGNGVGNIGSSSLYFNTVFAKATSAQYADLAEMYEADSIIEPGTVVCFGGAKEVTTCGEEGSRRVAGVVSTNPSYIMNAGLAGDNVVAVALTGRVPTKVTGTIRKGDMLVAAGGGRARAETNPAVGAVIGKALADFDGIEGVIEVVVGRL